MSKQETETRSAKGEGIAVGCLTGWLLSAVLIVVGVLLSLTGIGAILGVPMILMGILAPFVGPLMGLSSIKGQCPYCGSDVSTFSTNRGVTCSACKKRIVIRDKTFLRVE